jgi:hypothetical protein
MLSVRYDLLVPSSVALEVTGLGERYLLYKGSVPTFFPRFRNKKNRPLLREAALDDDKT